jgi:hypothetical protein
VIVDYLDRFWSTVGPNEADAVLVIDPYAVLASPIATQRLKPVAWRNTEVIQMTSRIELLKLEEHSPSQLLWHGGPGVFCRSPVEKVLRAPIAKGSDHINTITRISC